MLELTLSNASQHTLGPSQSADPAPRARCLACQRHDHRSVTVPNRHNVSKVAESLMGCKRPCIALWDNNAHIPCDIGDPHLLYLVRRSITSCWLLRAKRRMEEGACFPLPKWPDIGKSTTHHGSWLAMPEESEGKGMRKRKKLTFRGWGDRRVLG